jgi:hypothetical protein
LGDLRKRPYHQSLKVFQQLVVEQPGKVLYQFYQSISQWRLGELAREQNQRDQAQRWYDQAGETLTNLLKKDPSHAGAKRLLSQVKEQRGP